MKLNGLRIFSSGAGGTIGQIRVAGQVPGCKVFARAKGERTSGRLCRVDEAVPDGLTLNPGYAWAFGMIAATFRASGDAHGGRRDDALGRSNRAHGPGGKEHHD